MVGECFSFLNKTKQKRVISPSFLVEEVVCSVAPLAIADVVDLAVPEEGVHVLQIHGVIPGPAVGVGLLVGRDVLDRAAVDALVLPPHHNGAGGDGAQGVELLKAIDRGGLVGAVDITGEDPGVDAPGHEVGTEVGDLRVTVGVVKKGPLSRVPRNQV